MYGWLQRVHRLKPWDVDRLTDADVWAYAEPPKAERAAQVPAVGVVDRLRAKGWTTEQIQAHVNALKAKRRPNRSRNRGG